MFEKLIIEPMRAITENVYLFLYALTGNYGISLIALSFLSFILMTILMAFVGRYSERETAIQGVLAPQLLKIKDESKGRERYGRIAGLYRRYGYHPVLAMRSLIPVFVQVPFLFAAYFMLSGLKDIDGQSFLFIRDLGAPDSLFPGINFLPILMTAVNVATALATKGFKAREKIQAIVIAALFLALLYGRNSALLLFWTMNNIISLLKTVIKRTIGKPITIPGAAGLWKRIVRFAKDYPIYSFIIGLYPVVFLYSHNIKDTSFGELAFPLLANALLAGSLFAIGYVAFRKRAIAALFSSIGMVAVFYYKYSLYKLAGTIRVSNYILVFAWLIALAGVFLVLRRLDSKKGLIVKATPFINAIAALIFLLPLFEIALHFGSEFMRRDRERPVFSAAPDSPAERDNGERPDIYYLILDGYGSDSSLAKYYGYDNSEFTGELERKGFFVAKGSKSNYSTTYLSLCSSLNMQYMQGLGLELDPESDDRRSVYDAIERNRVVANLKAKGYAYVHFQTGWGADNKSADVSYRGKSGEFFVLWVNTSILSPIIRKLGITNELRDDKLNTFRQLARTKEIKGPKFVFCHIVLPHPPYLFGANGESVSNSEVQFEGAVWKQKKNYLNQLRFTNKKVIELLDGLFSDEAYSPVVIIQGDHGTAYTIDDWENPEYANIDERMSILNAIRLPKQDYRAFYDSLSPVNEFRLVFNSVFGSENAILEDEVFFTSYLHPYRFDRAYADSQKGK